MKHVLLTHVVGLLAIGLHELTRQSVRDGKTQPRDLDRPSIPDPGIRIPGSRDPDPDRDPDPWNQDPDPWIRILVPGIQGSGSRSGSSQKCNELPFDPRHTSAKSFM